MAKTLIEIDPLTRVSGLLSIDVQMEQGRIADAQSGGMQYRGLDRMLQGRPPLDAIRLTARTCGICSTAHTIASTMALEMALGVTPDFNGELIRALALGFDTIQNNIRQIYQLALPDYVDIRGISPLSANVPEDELDYRLPQRVNDLLVSHYQTSIGFSRNAHKALATIAGKAPHNHGIFVGGVTTNFNIDMYSIAKSILHDLTLFVSGVMIPDVALLMEYYPEYSFLGHGNGNYMSYGYFSFLPELFWVTKPGVLLAGVFSELNPDLITESIRYSWLQAQKDLIRPLDEPPTLDFSKPGAYSWVDAPRYAGKAVETGPMAGLIVSGTYGGETGALRRILARAIFTQMVCEKMQLMFEYVRLQPANQQEWKVPESGEGHALTGAMRGGLGHWIRIENQKIKNYSILPPSNWNMSPKSEDGQHGACEQALIGTPIEDQKKAKAVVGRIVRSFDPCLNCAAHVVSDRAEPFTFLIL
jgi:hydrogenase large subunit